MNRMTLAAMILIILAVFSSCRHETLPDFSFQHLPTFNMVKNQLDLSQVEEIKAPGNVVVYMVKYLSDTAKIYAASSTGQELLYQNRMINAANGEIRLTKDGEEVRVIINNGSWSIRTADDGDELQVGYHGGTRFCQRSKGEKFGDCFKIECDEFCDSFISCVALATQPQVAIVIGLSCSCYA